MKPDQERKAACIDFGGLGDDEIQRIAYAGAAMSTAAILPAFAQSPQQLDYNILSTTMVAEMILAFLSQPA